MPKVEYKGDSWMVDDDGFIDDFANWNEHWVEYTMGTEGINEMTEDHWKLVNYIQEYFKEYGIAPMVRLLTKNTGFKLKYMYELFPSGPAKGACKVAGLPKPTGCV